VSPRHHPPQAVLIDLAAGTLEAGQRLVVSAHLGACEACRHHAALAEAVGGAVMAALNPTPMSPDALALALARIERPSPPVAATPSHRPDWLPQGIIVPPEVALAATRRRRWVAPGVWVAPVIGGPRGRRSYLLRVAAGMAVPLHSHRGEEMVCVLKGAYADDDAVYGEGDFALNDESKIHRPRITDESECVCLIAVQGDLIARDWIGRLFQPFVGI
jgi:putative transcriptional regulator